jgi:hypothetical protein
MLPDTKLKPPTKKKGSNYLYPVFFFAAKLTFFGWYLEIPAEWGRLVDGREAGLRVTNG